MVAAHSYEVEIKSLLGSEERVDSLRAALKKIDPSLLLRSKNKQLNHYFTDGSLAALETKAAEHLSAEARVRLKDIVGQAEEFSVRTRDKDGEVLLVVKASMDSTTSENGIARLEFEEKVPMTLEELDALVLSAGFIYQAKWSREREEYTLEGINITLDKNAGYGWLAEFEKVVNDEGELKEAESAVRALMERVGVEELPQERLARMFAYYNTHWQEYYGTDKIFTIE